MTPTKLLIAQRLDETAQEIAAIVSLMADYLPDQRWQAVAADMARAGDTAGWWASEIRKAEQ